MKENVSLELIYGLGVRLTQDLNPLNIANMSNLFIGFAKSPALSQTYRTSSDARNLRRICAKTLLATF